MASETQNITAETLNAGGDEIAALALEVYSETVDLLSEGVATSALAVRRWGRWTNIFGRDEGAKRDSLSAIERMVGSVARKAYEKGFRAGEEYRKNQEE
jgi:hypothetical protein